MLHLLPLDRNLLNHRSLGISHGDPSCCVSLSPRIYLKTLLFPAKSESPLLMTTVGNDNYKSPQQLLQLSVIRLHVLCDLWAREEAPRFALARRDGSVCAPPHPPPDSRDSKFASRFAVQTRSVVFSRAFFFSFPPRWLPCHGGVGESGLRISAALKWSARCRKEIHASRERLQWSAEVTRCIINVFSPLSFLASVPLLFLFTSPLF